MPDKPTCPLRIEVEARFFPLAIGLCDVHLHPCTHLTGTDVTRFTVRSVPIALGRRLNLVIDPKATLRLLIMFTLMARA